MSDVETLTAENAALRREVDQLREARDDATALVARISHVIARIQLTLATQ